MPAGHIYLYFACCLFYSRVPTQIIWKTSILKYKGGRRSYISYASPNSFFDESTLCLWWEFRQTSKEGLFFDGREKSYSTYYTGFHFNLLSS